MRKLFLAALIVVVCGISAMADTATTTGTSTDSTTTVESTYIGLVDSSSRDYLADVRQLLCWIIGLQLVSLTRDAIRF
jgi:hypothetical protein